MTEALWQERLTEARFRIHHEVTPETCAERYDIKTREGIKRLTNAALQEMFAGGYGSLTLEDLDSAAAEMEVSA